MPRKVLANTALKTGKQWESAASYPSVLGPIDGGGGGGTVTSPAQPSIPNLPAGTWTAIFTDEFTGTALNPTYWTDHEPHYQGAPGYSFDAWYPVPAAGKTVFVNDSVLTIQARRDPTVPTSLKWRTGQVQTRDKWFCPANSTCIFEARMWVETGWATSPQWWLEGDDKPTAQLPNLGWSMRGEIDICEIFNIDEGYEGIPHFSLHWPKDYYTTNPVGGTRLNDTHVGFPNNPGGAGPKNPDGSYYVNGKWCKYTLYRSPTLMRAYLDDVKFGPDVIPSTSYNGSVPLPPMLFTEPQFLRLGLGVAGSSNPNLSRTNARPEPQWQEADLKVDYVKVWQKTA